MRIICCAYGKVGLGNLIELLCFSQVSQSDIFVYTYDRPSNLELLNFLKNMGIAHSCENINKCYKEVKCFNADYIISMFYRHILSKNILSLCKGTLNAHQSLLPLYRGRYATFWMIYNGDEEAGITYHYMDESVDTGNILLQERCPIREGETAYSLYHKLTSICVRKFCNAFELMMSGVEGESQQPLPDDDRVLAWHENRLPFDGCMNLTYDNVHVVERFCRAMYFPPLPSACLVLPSGEEIIVDPLHTDDILRLLEGNNEIASGLRKA